MHLMLGGKRELLSVQRWTCSSSSLSCLRLSRWAKVMNLRTLSTRICSATRRPKNVWNHGI